ncbi:MAG TPA: hypothetical protein VHV75_03905 [Solirubrobacteraceae bacterium]|jgi:uncharacterized membrane protein|nr:hypothetical protein [Solirubrobacteraceae bacterium]
MTASETNPTGGLPQPHTVELGLLVTPALDDDVVRSLAEEVGEELARRYPGVEWQITAERDLLVSPPARLADVFDTARTRMLDRNWDLAVHVTELPLRISRRPLVTHTSRTHGVAIVSLPALGLKQSSRHLVRTIADAVGIFVGDDTNSGGRVRGSDPDRIQRRWVELTSDVDAADALADAALLHRVVAGNVRLLIGMVRANHPWRLATSLSRTLVGAVGVGAFAIVTSDIWRIAAQISAVKLAFACLATVSVSVGTLIAVHGLWERALDRTLREQAIMFNLVTLITVGFGIAVLYVTLCVVELAGAWLLINPSLLSEQIGHASGLGDYLRLALLAGALATIGGALGAALESGETVREAAYGYRPQNSR